MPHLIERPKRRARPLPHLRIRIPKPLLNTLLRQIQTPTVLNLRPMPPMLPEYRPKPHRSKRARLHVLLLAREPHVLHHALVVRHAAEHDLHGGGPVVGGDLLGVGAHLDEVGEDHFDDRVEGGAEGARQLLDELAGVGAHGGA